MIKATKLMITDEHDFAVDETKHKYGTRVDWLDCDAETFIDYWLPKFDQQNGIEAPLNIEQPYKPVIVERREAIRSKQSKGNNEKRIMELITKTPMTLAEIARALNFGSPATAHKEIVNNPAFQVVAEKRVGKNPYVKVWGVR